MFEMPGESSTHNSPYSTAKKEGTPQSRRGNPGLTEATTSLPSWIFTGRYDQPHGLIPGAPLTQYSGEAIREIKAQYAAVIGDAKNAYGTTIRKAEAICLASTNKVEVTWPTSIRKAKAANAVKS